MPPARLRRKGKRQRFYARNAVKTTLDPRPLGARRAWALMRSFWANRAHPSYQTRIHPALTSFADECCATLARLLAYVGTLALVAHPRHPFMGPIAGGRIDRARRQSGLERGSPLASGVRRQPVRFTRKNRDLRDIPASRRGAARTSCAGRPGRKQGERPVAELEIYRPGGEFGQTGPPSPTSPRAWIRRARANWKRPASSTASSAR